MPEVIEISNRGVFMVLFERMEVDGVKIVARTIELADGTVVRLTVDSK